MSILPPKTQVGKRCLIYCGDYRCNCDCNPRYKGFKFSNDARVYIANDTNNSSKFVENSTTSQKLDQGV